MMGKAIHYRRGSVSRSRSLRLKLEREIDRLIAMLDAIDGDPDDEPSLAAPEPAMCGMGYWRPENRMSFIAPRGSQEVWAVGGTDDREFVNEDGGDILDKEKGHIIPGYFSL